MIKSLKIDKNISLKILKKNNTKLILLGYNKRELFILSKYDIYYNNGIIISNKNTINIIKQGINNLLLWNKREIIFKGVGSKLDVKNKLLTIKVSNTSNIFNIPKDINVKILNSPLRVVIWGNNINIIDKFKNNIIKKLPKKSIQT